MIKYAYAPRERTRSGVRAERDLIDRWYPLEPHERRRWWETLTRNEQDVLGDSYGYKVARGA